MKNTLYIIAVILFSAWLLGVAEFKGHGLFHIVLVLATTAILIQLIRDDNP